ncbi:hypothetical protein MMP65_14155 [Acinetobacter sp. ANC 3926]|uniref:Uncharacterized protein n=1 Tax=Acinetobacter genomosp. 15BJ TaxID=106651 RepID=R9AJR4_9GAMM|nr:hypothetical protein [Acinetobacter genomosp. 15BJ]EOR02330.1 hypothetical protein F896_04017 [Acinetobacter genomosp. 15BJ]MCH7292591.1 hypothetical protein [Acinetobacter genomosp. 15BJ]
MKFNPFAGCPRTTSTTNLDISKFTNPQLDNPKSKKPAFFKDHEYIVIWYGKIKNKSQHRHAQKLVEVMFANITALEKGKYQDSGYQITISLPLEIIPSIPIGSIWANGCCIGRYDLENMGVTLKKNYKYQVNYAQTKNGESQYAFDPALYPVSNIINDGNSLIVAEQADDQGVVHRIIIHPLQFFNALYGASKEINRILLTYLWGEGENPSDSTISQLLHLNYINRSCPDAVFLSEKFTKGDAVFLYHLRNSDFTKKVVKALNSRVLANLQAKRYSYLKVEPYHKQPIEMIIKAVQLSDDSWLCTQINAISMPEGKLVYYDIANSFSTLADQGSAKSFQTIKPIYQNLETDDLVVEAELGPNNQNTAILREKVQSIGKAREVAKNQNIDIVKALNIGKVIPITAPELESYATGIQVGTGGHIGRLQAVIDLESGLKSDTLESSSANQQLAELLNDAKSLRGLTKIDSYTFNEGFQGETLATMTYGNLHSVYPKTILVLRVKTNSKNYFIIDCEPTDKYSSSGLIFNVDDEQWFLSDNNPLGLRHLVYQVLGNRGTLSKTMFKNLESNVATFNHVKAASSNWIRNGINNLT